MGNGCQLTIDGKIFSARSTLKHVVGPFRQINLQTEAKDMYATFYAQTLLTQYTYLRGSVNYRPHINSIS